MAKKIEQVVSTEATHQVTLNEAVETVTGEPTLPDTLPIVSEQPKKTRSKPGENRVLVTLHDADFTALEKTADGRGLNVWLGRLLSGRIGSLAEQYLKER